MAAVFGEDRALAGVEAWVVFKEADDLFAGVERGAAGGEGVAAEGEGLAE